MFAGLLWWLQGALPRVAGLSSRHRFYQVVDHLISTCYPLLLSGGPRRASEGRPDRYEG
jgi:hypothetical protein